MLPALLLAASLFAADADVLARIEPRMRTHVDRGAINGTVSLLIENGQTVHFAATGWADKEINVPMRKDSVFQIMSMTKPFTGVAIMMLVEEAKANFIAMASAAAN